MTLGEVVNRYRKDHGLTMEEFARKSGLSKGYISMLEANENPRSKKPIVPSLDTYRAVAAATGQSLSDLIEITSDAASSAHMELEQETSGLSLSKDRLKSMLDGIEPPDTAPAIDIAMIPIIGEVAAGMDIVAQQDIRGYYPAPSNIINDGEDYFYLIVDGDSMTPEINEGDLILVRKQTGLDNGDIGVFLLDKHEGVVKRFLHEKDRIELISVNPYYPPRVFPGAEALRVYVIGKVISSVRRYA